MKTRLATAFLGLCALGLAAAPAFADDPDSPAARQSRWQDLEKTVFHGRTAGPSNGVVTLEAPERAEDAALVPMTVTLKPADKVKALWLIIDDNPMPVAAHLVFGPAADPHQMKFRVRVNSYTNVHAVAELPDGSLVADEKFVKASGGCSAPMGEGVVAALKGIGEMRLKFAGPVQPGAPVEAKLMIRHPNFNGMQMNQVTRLYTPARYLDKVSVRDGDAKVFDMDSGISLASNPVLSFGLIPQASGRLTVEAYDSRNSHWRKDFDILRMTN
ncbi:quinoprotein dehydrogenase-associated SoxYZ-like carrier [Rhodoblastus acidophilus]|uniref:Quinoprotein dehydrogenase-associated SoxYZ-like carrier n=1 Tax=Candidatus Rhodoblastus alkanivorans TaxID=2954117 RepID=A0ABS9ZB97_9HYPH|nr:quinoprotein dehydrogenase-associated SoxYZ-like carrier [Candidatus Rhodoblastus alkanivorans]MCI4680058.1 quinoprotein dehydrogenase-associated SoxYZ-like carrier [Candidatus Rhodoblastus alkanivorans]MCI4684806.1 quinoprotein dehydrogenase-associated SoxYZ-like carrier [Candidatus Rhodoblastus alkanivorans]MDI4642130.1 quinoprotein dehydrogenase-associated SoxYZ-like carrier [Rhodoblastus acidophilus]